MATSAEVRSTKSVFSIQLPWVGAPVYVLAGYAALALIILVAGHSPLRVILATVLGLFGSGYSLAAVLFRDRDLDAIERLALSVCLSQAVGGMLGFFLARSTWGLRLLPLLVASGLFNLSCYVVISWKNGKPEDDVLPRPSSPAPLVRWWGGQSNFEKIVTLALLLMLVSAAWGFYRSLLKPKLDPPMTEFYLLDIKGLAEGYPREAWQDETLSLNYGIANREAITATYQVQVISGNRIVGESPLLTLSPDDRQESSIEFKIPEQSRGLSKIDFLLFKENKPYRSLRLWLEIKN